MTPPRIQINTTELSGDYTQIVTLPRNSKILDLVRRNVQGYCSYTLVYEYESAEYNTSQFEIVFNGTGYEFEMDKSYRYLATVQHGYDESAHSIVHWRVMLTDAEKRELKIDHLLT